MNGKDIKKTRMRHLAVCVFGCLVLAASWGAPMRAVAAAGDESCECELQRPEVLAVVNGTKIYTRDIESDTAELVQALKDRMDAVREQSIQSAITSRLVELEAKKQGLSTTKYLQQEVVAKVPEPTEAEVQTFYERNRASIPGNYDEVRPTLYQYIRAQRQQVEMTLLTGTLRGAAKVEILDYSPKAPTSQADRAKVVATVNDSKITIGDIEEIVKPFIFPYRQQVFVLEKRALDGRIDVALIEQEALRRGVTPQALIDAEVVPRAKKVDAFDASTYYNKNKEQFGGRSFVEVRDDLIQLMQSEAQFNARHAYAETLRASAKITISLVEPAPPTYEISTANRPARGSDSAPVTMVVFSDFECGKCRLVHDVLDDLLAQYNGKLRVVVRNFPLEQHREAFKAAEAAEAAREQGKYWEYAEVLFGNQTALTSEKLKQYATDLGLDRKKFDAALDSGKHASLIEQDLDDGTRIGINGTPAVYVNGRPVDDDSLAGLKAAVDAALRERATAP